ncbi:hypothetical protein Patl1_30549 [Pistacia atlantica]|uniref:Uncharacterized protein n=1 Tax=Pistacia atlantica TaxID=434234 RepID=A0ACC1AD62_9ROSI|nr:hypothetical protein Patl1_30549 [Pistacia atlantica]
MKIAKLRLLLNTRYQPFKAAHQHQERKCKYLFTREKGVRFRSLKDLGVRK